MWKSLVNLMLGSVLLCGVVYAPAGDTSAAGAMEWQMMPGESLNSLAALFYPKDKRMQQRFVASTLKLNREQMPELSATQTFDDKTALQIPKLHDLSRLAAKPRKRKPAVHSAAPLSKLEAPAAAPATVAAPASAPLSKEQKASVGALEKRVDDRQKELDKLNQRLKALEENSKSLQDSIKANSQPIEEAQGRRLKRVGPP